MYSKKTLPLSILFGSFFVIGLPSHILIIAWLSAEKMFGVNIMFQEYIIFLGLLAGIVGSTYSGYFIKRYSTYSLVLSCAAILACCTALYLFSPHLWMFMLVIVLTGIGSDFFYAVLNRYAAEKCSSGQMNWLYGFLGIGSVCGTFLMSKAVASANWKYGYGGVCLLQLLFVVFVFCSQKKFKEEVEEKEETFKKTSVQIKGKKGAVLVLFFIYGFIEMGIGSWFFSFLTNVRGMTMETAGKYLPVFWGCLKYGRFLIGIVSLRIGNLNVLKICFSFVLFSFLLLMSKNMIVIYVTLALMGIGLSGVLPALIYETPRIFGSEEAKSFVGYQFAASTAGYIVLTSLFDWLFTKIGLAYSAYILFSLAVVVAILMYVSYFRTKEPRPL